MKSTLISIFLFQSLVSSPGATLTPASKMMPVHKKSASIEQVSSDGALITLSNGKKYIVHEENRQISGGWLLPSKIKIYKTEDPNVFIMKNLSTQAKVHVRRY
jgi:uncharacterized protein YlzI (FlbEa/FlbD family)